MVLPKWVVKTHNTHKHTLVVPSNPHLVLYQLLHHVLRACTFVGNVGFSWNAASCHNGWLVPSKVLSFFSFASISSTLVPYNDTGYTNCCIDFWNMSFTHHG